MQKWDELLAGQDGVLSRGQAMAAGMTREAWAWKLESGRWRSLWQGVALGHTGEPTLRQLGWAAQLHAGKGALVSGDAGLALRGLHLDVCTVDVVVPPQRRVVDTETAKGFEKRVKVVVRRSAVPARHSFRLQSLPVTDSHLTTLHAAAWATDDATAERRVAAAVQRGLTATKQLRAALLELPRLPRRALIMAVLDDVELGAHAGSELQFLRFCRQHRLPIPDSLQLKVRQGGKTHYLDARYDRLGITCEIDGTHHKDVAQWESDALRSLRVAVAFPGERVIRLTPGMLRHSPDDVVELLRHLLAGDLRKA